MPDPTPYLTRSGKAFYNKLTERQKLRPLDYLRPHNFTDYDAYNAFGKQCRIAPIKDRIGSLTDPAALDLLCEILADLSDKIDDLESNKADKPYDY
jgi:hypothetical protein